MKVKCSNCGWEGESEKCPNCHTCKYLMTEINWEEILGIEMLEDERQTDYSYLKIDEDATLHEADGD